ncbi:NAD(P)/FAD-dependent oxidoreductase [Mesorhizobium sp. VNQ89]|uniref:NAD(P)/FAD-dependent oxidoreductase n=1 Tax=Mesorhizobium quangtriensis TaxID=3157709 RepID=UPI0032B7A053
MDTDVAIIGGSFAGLSAALQLARARRSVTVLDTGEPRNRFAEASHGFLAQDGVPPGDILTEARRQLAAYKTTNFLNVRAKEVSGSIDTFSIVDDAGNALSARRIILAHGVTDSLPDIPGLAAEWGKRVAHCPNCHGYEFGGNPLGVLAANSAMAIHHAMLVREWGPVTLFLNGMAEPDAGTRKQLAERDIVMEARIVEAVSSSGNGLAMVFETGGGVEIAGLFTQPRSRLSSDIGVQLGCVHMDGPFGEILSVDEMKQTSVPGVFAAGDIARPAPNVPFAVADGAMAGAAAHRSLVFG